MATPTHRTCSAKTSHSLCLQLHNQISAATLRTFLPSRKLKTPTLTAIVSSKRIKNGSLLKSRSIWNRTLNKLRLSNNKRPPKPKKNSMAILTLWDKLNSSCIEKIKSRINEATSADFRNKYLWSHTMLTKESVCADGPLDVYKDIDYDAIITINWIRYVYK